jgi:hypothetical protein
VKVSQKGNTKMAMEMSMNGQVMNKQVYADGAGSQSAMGQAAPLEGEGLGDAKEQAMFVKEAAYKASGHKLTLKGIEDVNGSNAYVIEVVRADGKKSTEYYDMKTSLKVREVSTSEGPDGAPNTQTIDMSDYKAIGGVLFPHVTTITGVFPVPFKVTINSAKVNQGIDDAVFKM